MNNEIQDIHIYLDNLLIHSSEMRVKLDLLTDMVLGVYKETLPQESYLNNIRLFLDNLEKT